MTDLKLTPEGDLDISGFDLKMTTVGPESTAQALRIRLKTHLREWFLDKTVGVPWITQMFAPNATDKSRDRLMKSKIGAAAGVKKVLTLSSTFNSTTREYSLKFSVRDDQGVQINISEVF